MTHLADALARRGHGIVPTQQAEQLGKVAAPARLLALDHAPVWQRRASAVRNHPWSAAASFGVSFTNGLELWIG